MGKCQMPNLAFRICAVMVSRVSAYEARGLPSLQLPSFRQLPKP